MLRTKGNWNWYQLVELHIVAHDVIKNLDWLVFRSKIEVGDPAAWAFEDCPAKYADVGQLKTVEINFPRPGRIEIKRSSSILTWGICWPKLNLMDPPPPLNIFCFVLFPRYKILRHSREQRILFQGLGAENIFTHIALLLYSFLPELKFWGPRNPGFGVQGLQYHSSHVLHSCQVSVLSAQGPWMQTTSPVPISSGVLPSTRQGEKLARMFAMSISAWKPSPMPKFSPVA